METQTIGSLEVRTSGPVYRRSTTGELYIKIGERHHVRARHDIDKFVGVADPELLDPEEEVEVIQSGVSADGSWVHHAEWREDPLLSTGLNPIQWFEPFAFLPKIDFKRRKKYNLFVKLKYLFYLQAVALLITSAIWTFAPKSFYSSMNLVPLDQGWLVFGQNTGLLLFGFFLIAIFAARAVESPLKANLRLSFFLLHAASLLVYLIAWFSPHGSISLTAPLVLHTVFALSFGYFQFLKPNS